MLIPNIQLGKNECYKFTIKAVSTKRFFKKGQNEPRKQEKLNFNSISFCG